jgi:RNA polymerase sigma-70 factor (ECF subfamily)
MSGSAEQDERKLVLQAIGGDKNAFEGLVDLYQDRVYNLSFRLTGRQDLAWDLSQEAFMKAFAAISGFKGEAGFYTWIYRIVLNLHINREKSLAGRLDKKSYSMDNPGDEDRGALRDRLSRATDPDPSEEPMRKEREAAVQAAIAALPPDYRQAVLLRDMEGLSYDEIAQMLSIPVGTVRSRLHRAREELKRRLQGVV